MDFTELLKKRKSVRTYSDEEVSREDMKKIIEAGSLAPTSRNLKSVQLVVVESKSILEELSKCKAGGSQFLKNAASAVMVIGDTDVSDVWIEDCSIALTIMHLKATELGLGSCWIQCRNRYTKDNVPSSDYITDLINLPSNKKILGILSIGHIK